LGCRNICPGLRSLNSNLQSAGWTISLRIVESYWIVVHWRVRRLAFQAFENYIVCLIVWVNPVGKTGSICHHLPNWGSKVLRLVSYTSSPDPSGIPCSAVLSLC
jgi:hypothetical protein